MRSTEMRAIGELAGRTLAGAGTMVRDLHMAVAGRAFTAVGPGGAPARVVHDGVAEALYGGVRTALEALPARRGLGRRALRPARGRRSGNRRAGASPSPPSTRTSAMRWSPATARWRWP